METDDRARRQVPLLGDPTTHMHTLKVAVFDVSDVAGGFSYDEMTSCWPAARPAATVPPRVGAGPLGPRPPGVGRGPGLRPVTTPVTAGMRRARGPTISSPPWWPTFAGRHCPGTGPCGSSSWSRDWTVDGSASWRRCTMPWPTGRHRRTAAERRAAATVEAIRRTHRRSAGTRSPSRPAAAPGHGRTATRSHAAKGLPHLVRQLGAGRRASRRRRRSLTDKPPAARSITSRRRRSTCRSPRSGPSP